MALSNSLESPSSENNLVITSLILRQNPFRTGLQETVEVVCPRGMAQLAQSFGFNLADPLAGDTVQGADFLQRVAVPIDQTKTHFENFALPLAQTRQNGVELLF